MCFMLLWKCTFYRNDDLSKPCQCRQINIYCLITNQTPALLVLNKLPERELQWCYYRPSIFLAPLPLELHVYMISEVRPVGHFKIKMAAINSKTRYFTTAISRKNRELWTVYFARHPLSTPESFVDCRLRYRSWTSGIWSSIRRGAGRQKPWRFA